MKFSGPETIIPCWHTHHLMDFPIGFVDIEHRRRKILFFKPIEEHELRFKLLKPVHGALPAELIEAYASFAEANRAMVAAYEAYRIAWINRGRLSHSESHLWDEATQACGTAYRAYQEAWRTYSRASSAWKDVIQTALPEVMKLHTIECGCPWTPDNRNIFETFPRP